MPSRQSNPSPSGELNLIKWIREQGSEGAQVILGPGDDTAVFRPKTSSDLLITTDMMQEGTDFRLSETNPVRIGRKAMAINLSDIAAMAGRPLVAVVSVALPKQGGRALAEALYRGMRELADEFQAPIIGGDTGSWDGPLVISITIVGEVTGMGPVTRAGAKPGDWLFVTGPLGGSLQGKHLDFTPRIREAQWLHQEVCLRAMIDISDGLARDLSHICTESGCGAVLSTEAIPITETVQALSDAHTPLEHALRDGEDFELLFAVSPEDGARLLQAESSPVSVIRIGECVDDGLWIETQGNREPLEPTGYEHEAR